MVYGFAALCQSCRNKEPWTESSAKCCAWIRRWHILTHYYDTGRHPKLCVCVGGGDLKAQQGHVKPSWEFTQSISVSAFNVLISHMRQNDSALMWQNVLHFYLASESLQGERGVTWVTNVGCRIAIPVKCASPHIQRMLDVSVGCNVFVYSKCRSKNLTF